MGDDIISRYDKLTQEIDEIYKRSDDLIGAFMDEQDTMIDPWSQMEDVLGVDILLQVEKVNKEVQN